MTSTWLLPGYFHRDTDRGMICACWTGQAMQPGLGEEESGNEMLCSVFVPFYSPKAYNWRTHFSNLAQTSIFCNLHREGPWTHNCCSTTKCQQSSWATYRPGRKRESSVPTGGKITKPPSVRLLDDIWYMVWAFLWIPDKSICYWNIADIGYWNIPICRIGILHQIMSKSQFFSELVLHYAPILGRNEAYRAQFASTFKDRFQFLITLCHLGKLK